MDKKEITVTIPEDIAEVLADMCTLSQDRELVLTEILRKALRPTLPTKERMDCAVYDSMYSLKKGNRGTVKQMAAWIEDVKENGWGV